MNIALEIIKFHIISIPDSVNFIYCNIEVIKFQYL